MELRTNRSGWHQISVVESNEPGRIELTASWHGRSLPRPGRSRDGGRTAFTWLETKNRETDALGDLEGARTAARRRVLGDTTTTATEASVATGNRIEEHLLWKLTYTPWEIEADPYALARLRTAEDELRRAEQGR